MKSCPCVRYHLGIKDVVGICWELVYALGQGVAAVQGTET